MPIYEDQYFKDYVNSLPAATENDLAAGNKLPLQVANEMKGLPSDNVAKDSVVAKKYERFACITSRGTINVITNGMDISVVFPANTVITCGKFQKNLSQQYTTETFSLNINEGVCYYDVESDSIKCDYAPSVSKAAYILFAYSKVKKCTTLPDSAYTWDDVSTYDGIEYENTNLYISGGVIPRFTLVARKDAVRVSVDDGITIIKHNVKTYKTFSNIKGGDFVLTNYQSLVIDTEAMEIKVVNIDSNKKNYKIIWLLNVSVSNGGINVTGLWSSSYLKWCEEHQFSRVGSIVTNTTKQNSIGLLVYADIHGSTRQLKHIVDFKTANNANINAVINLGDVVNEKYGDDYILTEANGAKDHLLVIGNHDIATKNGSSYVWNYTASVTPKMVYDSYLASNISNWGVVQPANAAEQGKSYYYKDFAQNLRLIVCDNMLANDATTEENNAHKEWLTNVLNDSLANGKHVLIAGHGCGQTDEITEAKGFCSVFGIDSAYQSIGRFPIVQNFINAGGIFIGHIAGHTHYDGFGTLKSYPKQLVIRIDTASQILGNSGGRESRIVNAITDDAFNLISICTANKTIRMARIGCNVDGFFRPKNTILFDYGQMKVLCAE